MDNSEDNQNSIIAREIEEIGLYLFKLSNQWKNYMEKCQQAANIIPLHVLDIIILHLIRGRSGPIFISDISFAINKYDTAAISYSLQKLTKLKLVKKIGAKSHKNIKYEITSLGIEHTKKFVKLRKIIIEKMVNEEEFNFIPGLINYFRALKIIYEESTLHITIPNN